MPAKEINANENNISENDLARTESSAPANVLGTKSKIWLLFASTVGLIAAFVLVLEKVSYWKQAASGINPTLSCNVNPIVGCGPVINLPEASLLFGIPNPLIGVVLWSGLGAVAILLLSGLALKGWHWWGLQLGAIFGILLVSFLQFESIFEHHVLCPWCMVTWAVMIPTFWLITAKHLEWRKHSWSISKIVYGYLPMFILLHFSILISLIFIKFGLTMFQ